MNQKTGICIILLLAAILIFGICCQKRYPAPEETQIVESEIESEQSIPAGSAKSQPAYRYLVKEEDGSLVVFQADGKTVYMETGIRTENLSEEIRKQAKPGIPFTSEKRLFDFLESYSS